MRPARLENLDLALWEVRGALVSDICFDAVSTCVARRWLLGERIARCELITGQNVALVEAAPIVSGNVRQLVLLSLLRESGSLAFVVVLGVRRSDVEDLGLVLEQELDLLEGAETVRSEDVLLASATFLIFLLVLGCSLLRLRLALLKLFLLLLLANFEPILFNLELVERLLAPEVHLDVLVVQAVQS